MTFYDAINHGITTMATGGFSTKNASIAYYANIPIIQYIIATFMFIAGVNYTLIYFSLKGDFKRLWSSDEFKTYLFLVLGLIILVSVLVFNCTDYGIEKSFRESLFQVISVITTTGFVSADYTSWTPFLTLLFFILLFVGASAGSTSGGIKIIRHIVIFKNSFLELKRLLHPKAIIRMKVDKKIVAPRIMTHVLVFLLLYLMLFIIGSMIMSVILSDFDQPLLTAIGAVATSLGNVGPSIAELGPLNNFADESDVTWKIGDLYYFDFSDTLLLEKQLSSLHKAMYHNKRFKPVSNTDNGETSVETVFLYEQDGHILTSTYSGGQIVKGHLIGIVDQQGKIEMRYHQINTKGELMTGICTSRPEILANGKIRLHETWQWTSGDHSKGESILEEI